MILAFSIAFIFYGLLYLIPETLKSTGEYTNWTFIFIISSDFVANYLGSVLVNIHIIGRKYTLAVCFSLTCICAILIYFMRGFLFMFIVYIMRIAN